VRVLIIGYYSSLERSLLCCSASVGGVLFIGYYSSLESRLLCCSASVGEGDVHRLLFILERRLL
jgi:hypothetical protein